MQDMRPVILGSVYLPLHFRPLQASSRLLPHQHPPPVQMLTAIIFSSRTDGSTVIHSARGIGAETGDQ